MRTNHELLIIEDSISVREMIKAHLERIGYVTHATGSPEEAFAILKDRDIDLIISDIIIESTDVTGYHVLKRVKQTDRLAHIPVVMMTERRDAEIARATAEGLGANGFLHKPFSMRELEATIKRLLRPLPAAEGEPR